MKKIATLFAALLCTVGLFAQNGLLDRFDDPEKGHTVFIPRGCCTIGFLSIQVGYARFIEPKKH